MINVKRYIINYAKFVTERIAEQLRFEDVIAFVSVCISQVVTIYNDLLLFRDNILYKLSITPQVCYLEKMLNDRYDDIERRITIVDGKEYLPIFLYQKAESKPTFLFLKSEVGFLKTLLYLKQETGQFTFDFVINIPVAVLFNQPELIALVNTYKLAAMTYKIKIV